MSRIDDDVLAFYVTEVMQSALEGREQRLIDRLGITREVSDAILLAGLSSHRCRSREKHCAQETPQLHLLILDDVLDALEEVELHQRLHDVVVRAEVAA